MTQRLLLAFITRNQHRLRPRALAFRAQPLMSGMAVCFRGGRGLLDVAHQLHLQHPRIVEMRQETPVAARPRALAFRAQPLMSGMAVFYLAFRSEQDALLTI
jgi:hypothetical protein